MHDRENKSSGSIEVDKEILPLLREALEELQCLIAKGQKEKAMSHLLQVFWLGVDYRPKVMDAESGSTLAVIEAPVAELYKASDSTLSIRTAGETFPQWWEVFRASVREINGVIRDGTRVSGLHGEWRALTEMPVDEAAEVIERMLLVATQGRTRLRAIIQ